MLEATVILNPIEGPQEILDPGFGFRPPLSICFPPPARNTLQNSAMQLNKSDLRLQKLQGASSLKLGRNEFSRIFDRSISRNVATVEIMETSRSCCEGNTSRLKLVMKVNQSNPLSNVHVNGSKTDAEEIELAHNDLISLHGSKYPYKVHIIDNGGRFSPSPSPSDPSILENTELKSESSQKPLDNEASSNSNSETSSNASQENTESADAKESDKRKRSHAIMNDEDAVTDQIQERAHKSIVDEMTCAICMEIIVEAHIANPCGHIFCKSCIDRLPVVQKKLTASKSCPSCRMDITNVSWARSFDNIIWNMVLSGEIFGEGPHGEEDLHQFMMRSGRNVHKLTEEERACIFKRCKRRRFIQEQESDDDIQVFAVPQKCAHLHPPMNAFDPVAASTMFQHFLPSPLITGPAGTIQDPICLDD